MSKRIISTILAGTLAASGLTIGVAHAQEHAADKTMEQRVDQAEAAIKDAWLDGKLESALLFNEHLNSFDIDTKVENKTAYLTGAVESDIDRDLAQEIAQSIDGISGVKNDLRIDKSAREAQSNDDNAKMRRGFRQSVANATMTARIKSELLVNSNTAGLAINVDSSASEVVLSGEVESEQEKELAGRIAKNVVDDRNVNNRLVVRNDS